MLITKELLKNKLFSENTKSYFLALIVNILLFFMMWLKFENLILAIIVTSITLSICTAYFILSHKAEKKFNFSNLYLVEDVFINLTVKKIPHVTRTKRMHFHRYYTIKFSKNGIHKFQSFGKLEPNDDDPNYITATYAKPGDKYYIAILESKGSRRILDCYNQKYFKLKNSDFEFIDGKYVCKQ
ncbi:MAG: hypothetical protein J6B80_01340 [Clostridia bacterium]|nr:hypothetical protein [Clostridia bacterium]